MASSPFSLLFLSLLFSTVTALPFLPPVAFNCTTSMLPNSTLTSNLQSLLNNLTAHVSTAHYAISTIDYDRGYINGYFQCRPHLLPIDCARCIHTARPSIAALCPKSDSVAAWFDACYIHYYYSRSPGSSHPIQAFTSQPNRTLVPDRSRFDPALNTLLLRLRADTRVASRRRYSSGEIRYGDEGSRVFALVECLEFLTVEGCDACVAGGVRKVHESCGGAGGGTVVSGGCLIRYESYRFFTGDGVGASRSDCGGMVQSNVVRGRGDGRVGLKGWIWFVSFVCFLGVVALVMGVWLLRRRIGFSKVRTFPVDTSEGMIFSFIYT